MASQQEPYYTPEQYLAFEREAEGRHEYLDGRIYAMTGGSTNHARLIGNVHAELRAQLRGRPCDAFYTQLRARDNTLDLVTCPLVSAVCGEPEFASERDGILLNPTVLVEVLSPSTERYDRGEKFRHYRRIPSLREYVLVSQEWMHVERFARDDADPARWVLAEASGPAGEIELPSIGCTLRLRDVYERADVPATPPVRVIREPDAIIASYGAVHASA